MLHFFFNLFFFFRTIFTQPTYLHIWQTPSIWNRLLFKHGICTCLLLKNSRDALFDCFWDASEEWSRTILDISKMEGEGDVQPVNVKRGYEWLTDLTALTYVRGTYVPIILTYVRVEYAHMYSQIGVLLIAFTIFKWNRMMRPDRIACYEMIRFERIFLIFISVCNGQLGTYLIYLLVCSFNPGHRMSRYLNVLTRLLPWLIIIIIKKLAVFTILWARKVAWLIAKN